MLRLRELREQHGLTQEKVAAMIDVDRSTYSKYEKKDASISATSLILLAQYYNVSVDYICGLTEDRHPKDVEFVDNVPVTEEITELVKEFSKLNHRQKTIIFAHIYEMRDIYGLEASGEPINGMWN